MERQNLYLFGDPMVAEEPEGLWRHRFTFY
jgi:hypothetical protein